MGNPHPGCVFVNTCDVCYAGGDEVESAEASACIFIDAEEPLIVYATDYNQVQMEEAITVASKLTAEIHETGEGVTVASRLTAEVLETGDDDFNALCRAFSELTIPWVVLKSKRKVRSGHVHQSLLDRRSLVNRQHLACRFSSTEAVAQSSKVYSFSSSPRCARRVSYERRLFPAGANFFRI